jgi:PAS domain S-box-containing protein
MTMTEKPNKPQSLIGARDLESCFNLLPVMTGIVEVTENDILHIRDTDATAMFFGKTREEIREKWSSELGSDQASIAVWLNNFQQAKSQHSPQNFFISYPEKSTTFEATVSYVGVGEDGRDRFTYLLNDVTQKLREQWNLKGHLESLFRNTPMGLATFDREHRYLSINEALAAVNGIPREETIGKTLRELFPEVADEQGAIIDKVFATKEIFQTEVIIPRPTNPSETGHWIVGFYPIVVQDKVESVGGYLLEITQQRKVEAELKKALIARDEFLSIASHELKTPLTSLRLWIQTLQQQLKDNIHDLNPEKVQKFLTRADRQTTKLNRLVDDMLDISRIRTGVLSIQKEEFDLQDLIDEMKARFDESFLKETGSPIQLQKSVSIRGHWDKMRIEQVVSNLLTNALRYGNKKEVSMSLLQDAETATIVVTDQGIGIAPENLQRIFERFERIGNANDVSGLGLGLFISKQIVNAHGGSVSVDSEISKGSTFTVNLPK